MPHRPQHPAAASAPHDHQRGRTDPRLQQWDRWLNDAVTGTAEQRATKLSGWAGAPGARLSHPREEHLLPLMVAAGAGGDEAGVCAWQQRDMMGGITLSSFRFGALPGG